LLGQRKCNQKKGHPRATAGQSDGRFPRRSQSTGPLKNSQTIKLFAQTVSAENSPPITPSSAASMGTLTRFARIQLCCFATRWRWVRKKSESIRGVCAEEIPNLTHAYLDVYDSQY
jgi:hypothetical protein